MLPEGTPVQVDGGIDDENIARVRGVGATLFVAGTSVFGTDDIAGAYRRLVEAAA